MRYYRLFFDISKKNSMAKKLKPKKNLSKFKKKLKQIIKKLNNLPTKN